MADITVTATSVLPGSGAAVDRTGYFGEAVTAGQSVYKKSSDTKWYKAQADGTAEESGASPALGLGVALNGGAAGQPAAVQTSGPITIGGTVVPATVYVVSTTYGGIAPDADLVSTNRLTVLGYGISATQIQLAPAPTGIVK